MIPSTISEPALRDVLLVRSAETGPPGDDWSDADRADATRRALATGPQPASADAPAFIARRAQLAAPLLLARDASLARAARLLTWREWVGPALIGLALVAGFFSDSLGAPRSINLLAPPLIGLLAWNLVIYAAMAIDGIGGATGFRTGPRGPIGRTMARWAHGLPPLARLEGRAARFADAWVSASAQLTGARVSAILHTAAAALALGAMAALYLKGIAFEYRAGWESTFFNAGHVTQILHVILGPASLVSSIALPDEAGIAAIAFNEGTGGENAARWIHLYAVTLVLFVVLPRVILAVLAARRVRALRVHLPFVFDSPYFDSLNRTLHGETARLFVIPYSMKVDDAQQSALQRSLQRAHGEDTAVSLMPQVAFGDEDDFRFDAGHTANDSAPAIVAILFPMTATPERENHGEFVRTVREQLPGVSELLVLVDESAFVARFAGQADRREQRRTAWRKIIAGSGFHPVFVMLTEAEVEHSAAAIREALSRLKSDATLQPPAFSGPERFVASNATESGHADLA